VLKDALEPMPDTFGPGIDSARPTAHPGEHAHAQGPLSGITVLDLSGYIAGPYGCALLGDLGAEVIKIEPPGGDTFRKYPSTLKSESRAFLGINRNKYGMILDLKTSEGQQVLAKLAATADVLVHNFRPSVAPRIGVDYERLKAINPRLIYCNVTGYGQSGPLRQKAGYDQVLQSMTGICNFQGDQDAPSIVYGSVVDYYAASMVAYGICAALLHRERSGKGQSVAISLLASALAMQSARFIWAEGEAREVGRDMRSGGVTGHYPTKCGFIYLSANTPHFWSSLCELVDLPELAADERYRTVRQRAEFADEIVPKIRAALMTRTAAEWEERFGERVPSAAVRPIEDMFEHPQVLAENLVAEFTHPLVGLYRGFTKPISFEQSPGPAPFAAPTFGQHTMAILRRNGFTDEEIARMRACGVIGPDEMATGTKDATDALQRASDHALREGTNL
jgi:crotonobetainyl-CoA:carnitine CoA-transferase CaiB-like acyl-CoA transferase